MAEPRTIRNLALAGFMGTGKSSVGQIVAEELGFDFVDTDAQIEARTGRKISDIFAEAGEGLSVGSNVKCSRTSQRAPTRSSPPAAASS